MLELLLGKVKIVFFKRLIFLILICSSYEFHETTENIVEPHIFYNIKLIVCFDQNLTIIPCIYFLLR